MWKDVFDKIGRKLRPTKYKNEALTRRVEILYEQLAALQAQSAAHDEQCTQIQETVRQSKKEWKTVSAILQDFPQVVENLRNHNVMLEGYPQIVENLRNHNTMLENYSQVLENIRNSNILLTRCQDEIDALAVKVNRLTKQRLSQKAGAPGKAVCSEFSERAAATVSEGACIAQSQSAEAVKAENAYAQADYFDFENHFRGNREDIKRSQSQYLKYFSGCSQVLDIGCGRGEFLELLKESAIHARGVDLYDEYVEYCHMKGLDAVCDDCIHYLRQSGTVDGIFVGQVAEHLETEQLMTLCALAYEKLAAGHYVIMETPNPTSLAIYTHAFYIDPSHVKPVHPLTLQYYMEKAGFRDIQIVYTESSRLDTRIPQIHLPDAEEMKRFNEAMQVVSETLFGSQDYAIIAKR